MGILNRQACSGRGLLPDIFTFARDTAAPRRGAPIKIARPRIGGERIKSARKLGTSSVASRHRGHHLARH